MAQKITISGALPGEEFNGLAADRAVRDFLDTPTNPVLIIGIVSNHKTTVDHDKAIVYPVIQVRHWEVALEADREVIAAALSRALAARSGAQALPFGEAEEEDGEEDQEADTEDQEDAEAQGVLA